MRVAPKRDKLHSYYIITSACSHISYFVMHLQSGEYSKSDAGFFELAAKDACHLMIRSLYEIKVFLQLCIVQTPAK